MDFYLFRKRYPSIYNFKTAENVKKQNNLSLQNFAVL